MTAASAGTHHFDVGLPPDPRARLAAPPARPRHGGIRARGVRPEDFKNYNMILAMDR